MRALAGRGIIGGNEQADLSRRDGAVGSPCRAPCDRIDCRRRRGRCGVACDTPQAGAGGRGRGRHRARRNDGGEHPCGFGIRLSSRQTRPAGRRPHRETQRAQRRSRGERTGSAHALEPGPLGSRTRGAGATGDCQGQGARGLRARKCRRRRGPARTRADGAELYLEGTRRARRRGGRVQAGGLRLGPHAGAGSRRALSKPRARTPTAPCCARRSPASSPRSTASSANT